MFRRMMAVVAGLVLLAGLAPSAAASPPENLVDGLATGDRAPGVLVDTEGEGTGLWVVQLDEPALASYTGGMRGLDATSPRATGAEELDVHTPASTAYLAYLRDRQQGLTDRMRSALGRPVEVAHAYRNVLNGLAVRVDGDEAAALTELPGVTAVYRDVERELTTDVSHDVIGSASVWDGDTGDGVGTRGEGVVVGMLDTGVNPDHPSFAATDGEGYTHENPYGSGTYVGVCDPEHDNHEDICNDKLIGAWNFHPTSPSAQDAVGHGSHVGATIAGNVHEAELTYGEDTITRTVRGVAPRANVISYLVCHPTCPSSSTVAAVDQAIADGVDVLNYSIGGPDSPWTDMVSLAFLEAYEAGIFVSASAGNAGPGPGTVTNTAPWHATVAATTTGRIFANELSVTDPAGALPGSWAFPGTGPPITSDVEAVVRDAGAVAPGNVQGCAPFPDGAFDGSIALVDRGTCHFATKADRAAAAGAEAVVVVNDTAEPPVSMAQMESTTIPAAMVDRASGQALRDLIADEDPAEVSIRIDAETQVVTDGDWEGMTAGFSSRGASQFAVLAPSIAAPGVNILSAFAAAGGDPEQYLVTQGTSMASPHVAGGGALLSALHPQWSPAEINSALAGTADTSGVRTHDGTTQAGPFDIGSGVVDLSAAGRAGVVLDETHDRFAEANPSTGGDPTALNVPNLVDRHCEGTCTWTRTLTSASDATATYQAATDAPEGVSVSVTPEELTLDPGAEQQVEITVEVDPDVLDEGAWTFAAAHLATGDTHANGTAIAGLRLPVAVIPYAAPAAEPSITVDPAGVATELQPGEVSTHELTIGNRGTDDLQWTVDEQEQSARRPAETTTTVPGADPEPRAAGDGARLAGDGSGGDAAPESPLPQAATRPHAEAGPQAPPAQLTTTVTHSDSQTLVPGTSAACSLDLGATTTANGFLRTFTLADFHIGGHFDVTEVQVGIENVTVPVTAAVNLYTMVDPAEPLTYDNLDSIGSAEREIAPQALNMVSIPVTGHAEEGTTLVVELDVPDLTGVGGFWPGANSAGQSAPTYVRAQRCGAPDPVEAADLGAPGMHLVMNVTGQTEMPTCDVPHDTDWVGLDPTTGTVAPGGSQAVEVTVDATGMPQGVHQGTLCLASNDPDRPLLVVPVSLEVPDPEFDLAALVWFERGDFRAELAWNRGQADEVEIVRDGEVIDTVGDSGSYVDVIGKPANGTTFDYQVCDADSGLCSQEATVVTDRRGGPPGRPGVPGPPASFEITTQELPELHTLQRYTHTLTASGGSGVYEWSASGLPDGLVLDHATGTLTNDPADPAVSDGSSPVEVTVTAVDAVDPALSATTTLKLEVVGVTEVAAGWGHTCAVTTEATAYCWGRNATGQIGDGASGDGTFAELPTPVLDSDGEAPLTGVVGIDGGDGHTCARTDEGTAYCWGASFDGRLGDGDPTLEPKPLPVTVRNPDDTGPLTGVVQIAVGSRFACALTSDEQVYCWGNNTSGKLGNGDIGGSQPLPGAVRNGDGTGPLTGATAVTAGGQHGCAVVGDTAHCWGGNSQGQLGTGEESVAEPLPVQVRDTAGDGTLAGVELVTASAGHTCALADGDAAYCWGRNSVGQVGNGVAAGNQPLPARVRNPADDGPLTGATELTTGDNHTCAVVAGGAAYCWGSNFYLQLGDPERAGQDHHPLPVAVASREGDDGRYAQAAAVTAGNGHTCVETVTGTVDCWGGNFNRQLGIGETPDGHQQPVPAPVHPGQPA